LPEDNAATHAALAKGSVMPTTATIRRLAVDADHALETAAALDRVAAFTRALPAAMAHARGRAEQDALCARIARILYVLRARPVRDLVGPAQRLTLERAMEDLFQIVGMSAEGRGFRDRALTHARAALRGVDALRADLRGLDAENDRADFPTPTRPDARG
jgi:hypothetical protein